MKFLIVQVSTWLYIPKLITFIYKYIAAEFKKEKCVNLRALQLLQF